MLCLVYGTECFAKSLPSVAFFYGENPPLEQLKAYDNVVLEPKAKVNIKVLNEMNSEALAYVSVGEIDTKAQANLNLPNAWILGQNESWNTKVLDHSKPEIKDYFLEQIFTPLWEKGYRGFFLDTLDSYQLTSMSAKETEAQIKGLVSLIKGIKDKFPEAKLIINRGFELLPSIHQDIYALAAESLFASWDESSKQYRAVDKNEGQWLNNELEKAKALGLHIIVIDYVPRDQKKKARLVANKIQDLGYIPWVADNYLKTMGHGNITPIPRKILVLYGAQEKSDVMETSFNYFGNMPIQYMGYVPIMHNISDPLPNENLSDIYSGIIVWLDTPDVKRGPKLHQWLVKQKNKGIKIVFIGTFGFSENNKNLHPFEIRYIMDYKTVNHPSIIKRHPSVGYEINPMPNKYEHASIGLIKGTPWLQMTNSQQQITTPIAITSWGGYALNPYVLINLPNDQTRWVINPFEFFQQALKLKPIPIPDTTTENGERLMLVHIDGDGFISSGEFFEKLNIISAEIIESEILNQYKIPTTVSIIQGEIAENGLYPKRSSDFEKVAKRIFELPWVEMASHSYSHPYSWLEIEESPQRKDLNLPIPNYSFNLKTDIDESLDYINQKLAPKDKRVKVYLWTGDTNPSVDALKQTAQFPIKNMNGGDTTITNSNNSITLISGLGTYKGDYYQVFAPNQNENVYTNDWEGPFYGYRNVIETFKLTNSPKRFKPINIYYHFYSASKLASLKALIDVYDWALSQEVMNIYASEYIDKVHDFNEAIITKNSDAWIIKTQGHLREFRINKDHGYPDLFRSKNIIGFNQHHEYYYLHLGDKTKTEIILSKDKPKIPYLVSANARIDDVTRTEGRLTFSLLGHMPLKFKLANMDSCQLLHNDIVIKEKETNDSNEFIYQLKDNTANDLVINCS